MEIEEEGVQLLQVAHSPYCQSVAIALVEKGVQFLVIEEDLANKSKRLLEANPVQKKVPVLIHNGRPVLESRVILQYIDDAWPMSSLAGSGGYHSFFPDTPYEKAQARFWADFIHLKVAVPLHLMVQARDSEIEREVFEEGLCALNSAIAQYAGDEKPFFFGRRLGYVDITFAPFISWFSSFDKFVNLQIPPSTQAPRLHEWIKALTQYPVIKPILTDPASIERKVCDYRARFTAIAAAGTD